MKLSFSAGLVFTLALGSVLAPSAFAATGTKSKKSFVRTTVPRVVCEKKLFIYNKFDRAYRNECHPVAN